MTRYEKPEIELFEIKKSDIITVSGGGSDTGGSNSGSTGGDTGGEGTDIGPWDPIM